MEIDYEKIFKPYCIDYFSKVDEETSKKQIEFVFANKDKSFQLFQSMYNEEYGTIHIDENLVSIHTGGWSDNEEIISHFKKTFWWTSNLRATHVGGHYYFDTDRNGQKEWNITKS